jgi:hypothetical protein
MPSVLNGSFYRAAGGGHAPGDLRDAFCEAVDAFEQWEYGAAEPTVELREQVVPVSQVFGLLWNCSDILPGTVWDQLGDIARSDDPPSRRTYGAAARWLKARIPDDEAAPAWVAAKLRDERRQVHSAVAPVIAAINAADPNAFVKAMAHCDLCGHLKEMMQALARYTDAPACICECFLELWRHHGDHMRSEAGTDILLKVLWRLLPRYEGPAVQLYRGEAWENRLQETHGMSWSTDICVARGYAERFARKSEGGSVLLQVLAKSSAIISRVHDDNDSYGEREFIIDGQRLRGVRVIERMPQISIAEDRQRVRTDIAS